MRILIIGPSWVGDSVISQSLFKTIHSNLDDAEIHVLAPEWTIDIFKRMKEVSKTIVLPFKHGELKFKERFSLGKDLENKYDRCIVLPNSLKASFVPFFANIPIRTGWRGEMRYFFLNDIRKLNKQRYPRMVERFIALGLEPSEKLPMDIPYPSLKVDEKNLDKLLKQGILDLNKPTISLCPGAEFGPSKRWPAKYYADIANEFSSRNWQILILGSPNDVEVGADIESYLNPSSGIINLTGKTSLVDVVDLLSISKLAVSNDSGLMHIAAAVDINLVALFGPSSPDFTPPLSKKCKVIRKAEGYSKVREGSGPKGYHQSLIDISPQEVLSELDKLAPH